MEVSLRPPAPVPMRELLQGIAQQCKVLSDQHRRAVPAEVVESRLKEILDVAAEVFHDRAMQICFLLDQHRSLRFNELHRMMHKMSTRTLAAKLNLLQERGLIVRRHYDESPPRVEYRLTRHGARLVDLVFPAILHVSRGADA